MKPSTYLYTISSFKKANVCIKTNVSWLERHYFLTICTNLIWYIFILEILYWFCHQCHTFRKIYARRTSGLQVSPMANCRVYTLRVFYHDPDCAQHYPTYDEGKTVYQWHNGVKTFLKKPHLNYYFHHYNFTSSLQNWKNNLWNRYRCMEVQMRLYNEFGPIVYHMRLYYDLYSNIWIFHRNFVFESMTCLNTYAYISLVNCKSSLKW